MRHLLITNFHSWIKLILLTDTHLLKESYAKSSIFSDSPVSTKRFFITIEKFLSLNILLFYGCNFLLAFVLLLLTVGSPWPQVVEHFPVNLFNCGSWWFPWHKSERHLLYIGLFEKYRCLWFYFCLHRGKHKMPCCYSKLSDMTSRLSDSESCSAYALES